MQARCLQYNRFHCLFVPLRGDRSVVFAKHPPRLLALYRKGVMDDPDRTSVATFCSFSCSPVDGLHAMRLPDHANDYFL